jgi:hypothetical protein
MPQAPSIIKIMRASPFWSSTTSAASIFTAGKPYDWKREGGKRGEKKAGGQEQGCNLRRKREDHPRRIEGGPCGRARVSALVWRYRLAADRKGKKKRVKTPEELARTRLARPSLADAGRPVRRVTDSGGGGLPSRGPVRAEGGGCSLCAVRACEHALACVCCGRARALCCVARALRAARGLLVACCVLRVACVVPRRATARAHARTLLHAAHART